MKAISTRHVLVAALLVGGCAQAESSSEDTASVDEAFRVSTLAQACGTPNPNLGEELSTSTPGGALHEWTDSINAMPNSSVKTDLLNRLLTDLQGPNTAFPDTTAQTTFLRNVRAPLPMTLPYGTQSSGNQVGLEQGWIYTNGGSHRGLDFARGSASGSDPSFDVLAIADGKVIGVYFDGPAGGGGNTIVIEHTGKNGKLFYTFYMHLRNGATHDANAVKGIDCSLFGDPVNCGYYKLAANKSPLASFWGTESDTITVTPGTIVKRGTKIARSGDTMTAIGHLDSNGNPFADDPFANNHLHVYFGAPLPAPNDKIAVEVDGFGAYQGTNTGPGGSSCYVTNPLTQTDTATYYSRLFAPFLPDFFNLGWTPFTAYPDYLDGMSYAPATLSFYDNSGFKVTGSYQYSTTGFFLQVGVAGSAIAADDGANKPSVPRETRVRIDGNGNPVYDFIATPLQAGEKTSFSHQLTQAQLDSQYNTFVINNGYAIGDFFPYRVNGVQFYAVLFTTSPTSSNWLTYGRSLSQVQADVAAIPAGLQLAQVVADTTWSPPKFSMIARPATGCAPHKYVDQSTSSYQSFLNKETALGYQLQKVQVYSGGTKYNAVYWRASGCAAQP